jgi:hypothetical protein
MPSSYFPWEPDDCPGVEFGLVILTEGVPQFSFSANELGDSPAERYSDDSGELKDEEVPDWNVELEGVG